MKIKVIMGASKRDLEMLTASMPVEHYHNLSNEDKLAMEIKYVDVKDYDYSDSELWVSQKKVSDKEFKKLKKIEFDLRNNNK